MVKLRNIDVRYYIKVIETVSQENLLFNEVSLHCVNRLLIDCTTNKIKK